MPVAGTRSTARFTRPRGGTVLGHELGVLAVEVEGRTIKIYDREKTICDCIRFRRTLGQDVVNEATRNYLQGPERNVDRVMEYSHVLRQQGPVRTHLGILGVRAATALFL
ncbi:MAG: hypothetical protein ACOCYB_09980 [Alkalispirochaeta sp.]